LLVVDGVVQRGLAKAVGVVDAIGPGVEEGGGAGEVAAGDGVVEGGGAGAEAEGEEEK
jgi:hypothetical protein